MMGQFPALGQLVIYDPVHLKPVRTATDAPAPIHSAKVWNWNHGTRPPSHTTVLWGVRIGVRDPKGKLPLSEGRTL